MSTSGSELPGDLIRHLREARRVAVLTGAGISAESGVSTFRDARTGLWARYDPQDLATPEAFDRDPGLVWDWYAWRRELVGAAAPNPGHYALVELERRVPSFTLVTQNVDSLHERAGGRGVIELHGNISRVKCTREDVEIEEYRVKTPSWVFCTVAMNLDLYDLRARDSPVTWISLQSLV